MFAMSPLRLADAGHLDALHQGTLEVLEKTGVLMEHPEAVAVFRDHGARVDGKLVKLPPAMVEKAIESAPAGFTLTARNEKHTLTVGQGQKRPHVEPNHGPIFVQNLAEGRRLGRLSDLADLYRLCQASDICDIIGSIPVEPSDLSPADRRRRIFYELLKNTDKCIRFVVGTKEEVETDFAMLEAAKGQKGWLDGVHAMYFSMNPLSPLCFDRVPTETIMTYARHNQPVAVLTCALSGVSAPLSLSGCAVLQNAEILAGLTLTQLISPGLPFMYCPASARANMQNGAYITGSPESNLINILNFQLALEKYHLPIRAMSGMTDSKTVDMQAGYETMQNVMLCLLGGAHVINETLGVLDCIMTTSLEKFVLDEEIIARVIRMMGGLNGFDLNLDLQAIDAVGPRGSYLTRPETMKNCRKIFRPAVSFLEPYEHWEKGGSQDVAQRAAQKCRNILARDAESFLSPEAERNLQAFLQG